MPVQVVHVGDHVQAGDGRERVGVDAGAGDDDHAQLRDALLRVWEGGNDPPQEAAAYARPSDGDNAYTLVVPVAELGAQCGALAEIGRVEAGNVAGEVEVPLGPVANHRQLRSEPLWDDVVGVTH